MFLQQNQHVQIISKRGNTEDSFAITEINYILKYIKLLSFWSNNAARTITNSARRDTAVKDIYLNMYG